MLFSLACSVNRTTSKKVTESCYNSFLRKQSALCKEKGGNLVSYLIDAQNGE